jgi:hypothetical protein
MSPGQNRLGVAGGQPSPIAYLAAASGLLHWNSMRALDGPAGMSGPLGRGP